MTGCAAASVFVIISFIRFVHSYLLLQEFDVHAGTRQQRPQGGERAFVAHVGLVLVGVEHEVGVVLVDGVVGEVDAGRIEVVLGRGLVRHRGEAHETCLLAVPSLYM